MTASSIGGIWFQLHVRPRESGQHMLCSNRRRSQVACQQRRKSNLAPVSLQLAIRINDSDRSVAGFRATIIIEPFRETAHAHMTLSPSSLVAATPADLVLVVLGLQLWLARCPSCGASF